MSRRDTIIITILINAGLLALLFMLAINTNEDPSSVRETFQGQNSVAANFAPPQQLPKPVLLNSHIVDEVDNFLKELPQEELGQPLVVDDDGYVDIQKLQTNPAFIVKPVVEPKENKAIPNDAIHFVEVIVKRGDALEKIARSNGTTVEAIKKANNMSSAKLSIGQVLRVPVSKQNLSSESVATSKSASSNSVSTPVKDVEKKITVNAESNYYTMKNGDNLWKIARQFQTTPENLLRLNDLDEDKSRALKVGDRIRVK